jgi:hypothetical protein
LIIAIRNRTADILRIEIKKINNKAQENKLQNKRISYLLFFPSQGLCLL